MPKQTRLLRQAAAAGAANTANGDVMLLHQSAAAFKLDRPGGADGAAGRAAGRGPRRGRAGGGRERHRRVRDASTPSIPGTTICRPEAAVALAVVRAASLVCRTVRRGLRLTPGREQGRSRSPVTVADLGAQVVVSLALAEALPDDPLMGEEDAQQLRADPVIAEGLARALDAVRPGIDAATMAAALERGSKHRN